MLGGSDRQAGRLWRAVFWQTVGGKKLRELEGMTMLLKDPSTAANASRTHCWGGSVHAGQADHPLPSKRHRVHRTRNERKVPRSGVSRVETSIPINSIPGIQLPRSLGASALGC